MESIVDRCLRSEDFERAMVGGDGDEDAMTGDWREEE